jgi:ankyrin repeat protein
MWASAAGHVGVVRWLVDQGAAIDARGLGGWTALMSVCFSGRTAVVRLLLEKGADPAIVDDEGSTPLITESRGGHLEAVRVLLAYSSARASINHRNNSGKTGGWPATGAVGGS